MKCVLCARRVAAKLKRELQREPTAEEVAERLPTLASGHVCVPCAARLQVDVADIVRLAADAAAYVFPSSTGSSGTRTVPGSRPPCRVEAIQPELTPVPQQGQPPEVWPSVLEVVEAWERMVREARGLAPYGPASAARTAAAARDGQAGSQATLTGCVRFLGAQVAWMSTEPDFPIEDFADEVGACVRVLRRWDLTAEERGTMVRCPTLMESGECGYRLYYANPEDDVTCRRCGATRSAMTLAAVAMADGAEVWLDPEAAASWLGVTEGTLRQWARQGKVQRSHGRYLVRERMGA